MSKVSSRVYRVSITLRSGHTGTLRLKVVGTDTDGGSQSRTLLLPLH
jgi:hypothetical protein